MKLVHSGIIVLDGRRLTRQVDVKHLLISRHRDQAWCRFAGLPSTTWYLDEVVWEVV